MVNERLNLAKLSIYIKYIIIAFLQVYLYTLQLQVINSLPQVILLYYIYQSPMRSKSQQSKGFLETCYYKFKASKSLRYMTGNPLLVPNMRGGNTLCPASSKKKVYHKNSESHYKRNIYQNWSFLHKNLYDIKKTNDIQNIKIMPATHQAFKGSSQLYNRVEEIKKQRKQVFKAQYSNIKSLKKSHRSYGEDQTNKQHHRKQENETIKAQRKQFGKTEENTKKQKQKSQKRNFLPTYPNKWQNKSQLMKTDELEGWEFIENQQDLRLSYFTRI